MFRTQDFHCLARPSAVIFLGLWLCSCDVPNPDAPEVLAQPSKAQLTLCERFAAQLVKCSEGQLTSSPNDGPRCGRLLANGTADCNEAFENFAACVTGVACDRLTRGACRLDYAATSSLCGGFLAADAAYVIGLSPLSK